MYLIVNQNSDRIWQVLRVLQSKYFCRNPAISGVQRLDELPNKPLAVWGLIRIHHNGSGHAGFCSVRRRG